MSSCVGGSKAPLGTISATYMRYAGTISTSYKTSGEDSCIATNEAIRNFCGGYYRVDNINHLCHIRYGMFPRNKSRGPRARSTRGPRDLLRKHT